MKALTAVGSHSGVLPNTRPLLVSRASACQGSTSGSAPLPGLGFCSRGGTILLQRHADTWTSRCAGTGSFNRCRVRLGFPTQLLVNQCPAWPRAQLSSA